MQIGLLTSDLTPHHGWGNYSLNLIESLSNLGHDLTILSASNSEPLNHSAHHCVLPTVAPQEPNFIFRLMFSQPKVSKLLAHCDIIHSTIEFYAPLLQWISTKRPTFMTVHGSYVFLPVMRRFPVDWLYKKAFENTYIISVSHYTNEVVKEVVPQAKASVVMNAIDATQFADIEHKISTHPIVVTLGGVKGRKGTHHLIEAIAKVRDHIPDVQCHVFGTVTAEPDYVAFVRQQIADLNLENTVYLHGFVEDDIVHDWYAKADVFVLPSISAGYKFEGFGLATMEASASGLPVIGTYGCGAEDVIEHGKTGLLVSQDNISVELSDAILELLNNRDKARQMGLAGRQKAQSRTWQNIAEEITDLYETALK